ncbi:MAG: hypothetical protein Q9213_007124 [Squamulea squamosa]
MSIDDRPKKGTKKYPKDDPTALIDLHPAPPNDIPDAIHHLQPSKFHLHNPFPFPPPAPLKEAFIHPSHPQPSTITASHEPFDRPDYPSEGNAPTPEAVQRPARCGSSFGEGGGREEQQRLCNEFDQKEARYRTEGERGTSSPLEYIRPVLAWPHRFHY